MQIAMDPTSDVVTLTPLNLLLSGVYLVINHKKINARFVLFFALAFTIGFSIEVIGVKTGLIFGAYSYGDVLGIKVLDVPLVIGLNWFLLVYATSCVAEYLVKKIWLKVIVAAALMTLLDVLIEPIAIRLDFWTWEQASVPMLNYIAWFFISALVIAIHYGLKTNQRNGAGVVLFGLQVIFFAVLNFTIL